MADETPSAPAPEPSEPQKKKAVKVKAEPFDPAQEPARKTVDAPPPPPPPPQQPPPPPPPTEDAAAGQVPPASAPKPATPSGRAWAMACHLTPLIDFGLTFLMYGFALPLILWLVKRDTDPEVDYHGKESLNFQLNLLFWYLLSIPLSFCLIGIPLFFALWIGKIVLCVVAAVKTAEGERYRYPFIYRVIQ
jgi:uncharacterized Tic20 family protein